MGRFRAPEFSVGQFRGPVVRSGTSVDEAELEPGDTATLDTLNADDLSRLAPTATDLVALICRPEDRTPGGVPPMLAGAEGGARFQDRGAIHQKPRLIDGGLSPCGTGLHQVCFDLAVG
jgi:hypothetical protein